MHVKLKTKINSIFLNVRIPEATYFDDSVNLPAKFCYNHEGLWNTFQTFPLHYVI